MSREDRSPDDSKIAAQRPEGSAAASPPVLSTEGNAPPVMEDVEIIDRAAEGRRQDRRLFPAALVAIGVLFLWRISVGFFLGHEEEMSPVVGILIGLVIPMGFTTLFPIIVIHRCGQRIFGRDAGAGPLLVEAGIAAPVVIATMMVTLLMSLVWNDFTDTTADMPEAMQQIAMSGNWLVLLLMVSLACLWAPWAEEIFFRRFLYRGLASRMSAPVAALLASTVFALSHQYTGAHFLGILTLGLVLTGVYIWRKTLATPIFIHVMQNSFASLIIIVLFFLMQRSPALGIVGKTHPEGCLVQKVAAGSGAAEAGLQEGDVISRLGGAEVRDFNHIRELLLVRQAGSRVPIEVLRNGRRRTVSVRLMSRDALEEPALVKPSDSPLESSGS